MKYLFPIAFLAIFYIVSFSQEKSITYYASYDLELIQVKNLKSGSTLALSSENLFEDDSMSFSLKENTETICVLSINNKTNSTCKINWDSAIYIDIAGEGMEVVHGYKEIEQEHIQSQTPSIIDPMSEITPLIFPKGYANFSNGEWESTPRIFHSKYAIMARDPKYGDNNIRIIIPVEMQGEVTEYLFEFGQVNYKIHEDFSICGFDGHQIINEGLVYKGSGFYSIGNKEFHFSDTQFHCFLWNSGNSLTAKTLRRANHHRNLSRTILPFACGLSAVGLICLVAEGPEYIAMPTAGFGLFVVSFTLRNSYNTKLKHLPDTYIPYK